MLEKELGRLGVKSFSLPQLVKMLRVGAVEELYGKIGSGDISMTAVSDAVQQHEGVVNDEPAVSIKRRRKTQAGNRFGLFAANRKRAPPVGEYDLARGGFFNTGHAIKKGGLAGAVRPDKADNFTPVNAEGDILEGFQAAETFVKLFYF